jgi:hypothetical protein
MHIEADSWRMFVAMTSIDGKSERKVFNSRQEMAFRPEDIDPTPPAYAYQAPQHTTVKQCNSACMVKGHTIEGFSAPML